MIELSVNLNKIALLRNSRGGDRPSVVEAAEIAIGAGAYGITVHPRPDMRHVRPHDVDDLARLLRDRHPGIELNIEGNPFAPALANGYPGFDALIDSARPDQCTLVPDSDSQLTSDHGWDLTGDTTRLTQTIAGYQELGARVSLFLDPDPDVGQHFEALRFRLVPNALAAARDPAPLEAHLQGALRQPRLAPVVQGLGLEEEAQEIPRREVGLEILDVSSDRLRRFG